MPKSSNTNHGEGLALELGRMSQRVLSPPPHGGCDILLLQFDRAPLDQGLDHADAVRLAPLSTAATVATARGAKIKPCGSCAPCM